MSFPTPEFLWMKIKNPLYFSPVISAEGRQICQGFLPTTTGEKDKGFKSSFYLDCGSIKKIYLLVK